MYTVGNPLLWGSFIVIIITMLTLDFKIQDYYIDNKQQSIQKIVILSLMWVIISLVFNGLLWTYLLYTNNQVLANNQALTFLTGYLLEKMLATDNVFIWLIILDYFTIPLSLQHRLLTWGIIGAIGLRIIMVFAGSWLINKFRSLIYISGLFLLCTGVKMALTIHNKKEIKKRPLIRWLYRHLRITNELHGEKFFIRHDGLLYVTPLLLAVIMIECSDALFSLDSIPAILAITTDPFIILTSNLFAILGLRTMYFFLAKIAHHFSLMNYALTVILIFIGIKMLIVDFIHVPTTTSLVIIITTLTITLLINSWINRQKTISNRK